MDFNKQNTEKRKKISKTLIEYKEKFNNEITKSRRLKAKYDLKKRFSNIFNGIFKYIPLFLLFYNAKLMKVLQFARYYNIGSLRLQNLIKVQGMLDFTINIYSIRPKRAKSFRELMVLNRNLFNKLITNPKRTNKKTFFGKVLITKIKLKQFYNTSIPKLRKMWLNIKSKKIFTIYNFIKNLEMSLKVIIYRLGIVKTMQEAQKLIKKRNVLVNNKYETNPLYLIKSKNSIIKFKSTKKFELYNKLFLKLQNYQLFQKNINEVSEFNIYNLTFVFFKKEIIDYIPPPLKGLTKPTTKLVRKYMFRRYIYRYLRRPYKESDKNNKSVEAYIIAKP